MIRNSAGILGKITFHINIVSGVREYLNSIPMVRNVDYEEMALKEVFQGL